MHIRYIQTVILLSAILLLPALLHAQRGGTTTYPARVLYPGKNVVTVSNESGIERIRYTASSRVRVEIPAISGCPKSVDINVWIEDPTTDEQLELTVYDCNGSFTSRFLEAEDWTILHENTGSVPVGGDTCLKAVVSSTERKVIDSIWTDDPEISLVVLAGEKPWVADDFEPLHYRICFRPEAIATRTSYIRLYVRRTYPNGGLTHYTIDKPVTASGVPAPEPVTPPEPEITEPVLPPLYDPTTFRNIAMPTAETLERGESFVANYDVIGWLGGYGITDRLTVLAGGAYVPEFISHLLVGTLGFKYGVWESGPFLATAGIQAAVSSTEESDIWVVAPYGVLSLGNRERRISVGGGYSWKRHYTALGTEFSRDAAVLAIGGDVTLGRGWKLAAETYVIESSGVLPIAVTSRWFGTNYAFDAGLVLDFSDGAGFRGTGTLSGEIKDLPLAPILSFYWVW